MSMVSKTREFTGWHMFAIMVSFFSVVIAVNLTMAFLARSSWTGFVAENTYVASQKFNEKAAVGRAQAALGWTSELVIAGGRISYRLIDKAGNVVTAKRVLASFRRPAYEAEDQNAVLTPQADGSLSSPVELRDGIWIVDIHAEAGLAHPYHDVRRLTLRNGLVQ
ncbi:MAG: FixH family protein [Rhizobiales bacterium]|nr:FixH family protein [Hyphomicrobiales bacterium]MBN8976169.1 FixH family protein [Hyphomicrobiales bacterium]MBN8983958.1 FixH family protein [Hyphomicrobiales bacterium]